MNPSRITILALLSITLAGCQAAPAPQQATTRQDTPRPRAARPADTTTAGAFDFYLLTLSWSPEFCLTHARAAECSSHPAFVLHGLWPQNLNGTYPQHCADTPGPINAAQYRDIYPDFHLLQHEWQTHGTCSGLAPDAYFTTARKAVHALTIPPALASVTNPIQLTPKAIIADFVQANPGYTADNFALSCGANKLTAVEVCLTKDLKPTSCQTVRTCRANVVKVTPPGATSN